MTSFFHEQRAESVSLKPAAARAITSERVTLMFSSGAYCRIREIYANEMPVQTVS